jgi:hypothetical protein
MAGQVAVDRFTLIRDRFRRRPRRPVDVCLREPLTPATRRNSASVILSNKSLVLLIDDNSGHAAESRAGRVPVRCTGLDPHRGSRLSVSRSGLSRLYHVHEFAGLAGVTVKTLHHYDRLGLLIPTRTEAGYRLYAEADLERLGQTIALKFLGFSLKQVRGADQRRIGGRVALAAQSDRGQAGASGPRSPGDPCG